MKYPSFTYCRLCFASHLDLSWVLRAGFAGLILNAIEFLLSNSIKGCSLHLATKFSLTRH